jgi:defect in organelle trafficking protein DotA
MRRLSVLLLFLITGVAFADPTSSLPHFFEISSDDQSVQLLTMLFGQVGTVLNGSAGILGDMFRKFNEAMLVLNVFVVGYTVLTGVLNTAHEGEFLGKNYNSIWIPIRAVLGIGLLVPTGSGYCLLQIIMMWIVLQGVGAADSVWTVAVKSINHAGSVVSTTDRGSSAEMPWYYYGAKDALWLSTAAGVGTEDPGPTAAQGVINAWKTTAGMVGKGVNPWEITLDANSKTLAANILQAQICMHTTYKNNAQGTSSSDNVAPIVTGQGTGLITYSFPAYTGSPTEVGAVDNHGCGQLSYYTPEHSGLSNKTKPGYYVTRALKTEIPEIITTLNATAKEFTYDCQLQKASKATNECITGKDPIGTAANSLAASLDEARASFESSQDISGPYKYILDQAVSKGWATAGAYYKYVAVGNDQVIDMGDMSKYTNFSSKGDSYYAGYDDAGRTLQQTLVENDPNAKANLSDMFTHWMQMTTETVTGAFAATGLTNSPAMPFNVIGNVVVYMLSAAVTGHTPVQIMSGAMFANKQDPISNVQMFGAHLIMISELLFEEMLMLTFAIVAIGAAGCAGGGMFYWIIAVTFKIFSLFFMLLGMLFVSGLVMEVYIPMIPYLIFFFGVLGWLIAVIETMLAAPLVAIGIAYPEGHQMLGRADPAVMLITNVFIRPTFMVFGFIAGIILSYVAIDFLNRTFEFVLLTNAQQPAVAVGTKRLFGTVTQNSILVPREGIGPFETITYLVIYIGTIMVIINKCFALIHVIPDQVLRWIGNQHQFGDSAQDEKDVAQTAKTGAGQASQAYQAGGQMAGQASKAAGSAAGSMMGSGGMDDAGADQALENVGGATDDGGGDDPPPGGGGDMTGGDAPGPPV